MAWAGLIASLAVGGMLGMASDQVYDRIASLHTYRSTFLAFIPILGALLVGVVVARHSVAAGARDLEHRMVAFARRRLGWSVAAWDATLEGQLVSVLPSLGYPDQGEVKTGLEARRALVAHQDALTGVASAVAVGTAFLVGATLWAVPASEVFLSRNFPAINSLIMGYLPVGALFALGGLLAVIRMAGR